VNRFIGHFSLYKHHFNLAGLTTLNPNYPTKI